MDVAFLYCSFAATAATAATLACARTREHPIPPPSSHSRSPPRAISLLRQQVKLQAANAFKAAAALASVPGAANATAAERAYQALLARGGVLGPGHPMMQNLAADPVGAAGCLRGGWGCLGRERCFGFQSEC